MAPPGLAAAQLRCTSRHLTSDPPRLPRPSQQVEQRLKMTARRRCVSSASGQLSCPMTSNYTRAIDAHFTFPMMLISAEPSGRSSSVCSHLTPRQRFPLRFLLLLRYLFRFFKVKPCSGEQNGSVKGNRRSSGTRIASRLRNLSRGRFTCRQTRRWSER